MSSTWQDTLITLFHSAPIAKFFGMTLSFDEKKHPHFNLPYNPNLDHALKGIHGGVIATLLDNAGIFAVSAQKEGVVITTSEFNTHLLHPAVACDLYAEGWVVKMGKRISKAEMRVTDSHGELVAVGMGTYVTLANIPVAEIMKNLQ